MTLDCVSHQERLEKERIEREAATEELKRAMESAKETRSFDGLAKPIKRCLKAVDVDAALIEAAEALTNELIEEKRARELAEKLERERVEREAAAEELSNAMNAAKESRDAGTLTKPIKRAKKAVGVDEALLGEGDSLPMWPGLPSGTLWNHSALCVESVPSFRMFVFGGQKAEFSYSDELHILDTGRMQFTQVNFAPEGKEKPSAREDCGIAYDTKSCRLLYFGGWKQGWMDDLWCLNVAGVVGPPYAVQSIGPTTGPITGNTPISIHGIGFIEGKQWDVRFTDGRREATVPGKFISPTELQCNTPSFEKFGPLEVMVRVAIKGDPFTVIQIV